MSKKKKKKNKEYAFALRVLNLQGLIYCDEAIWKAVNLEASQ